MRRLGRRRGLARLAQATDELLGLAHRQLLLDRRCPSTRPCCSTGSPAERPGVALAQAAVDDGRLDAPGRARAGAACSRSSTWRGRRGWAISSWVSPNSSTSGRYACGLLDRVEVRALEVLDEGQLELLPIGELADDRRDALEAGEPGRPEPALAGDELVAVEGLGDEDRLEDAVLADARREGLELGRRRIAVVAGGGWARIRASGISVDAVRLGALRDQRRETAAQAALPLGMDRS